MKEGQASLPVPDKEPSPMNPFKEPDYQWGDPPEPGECDPYRFVEEAITRVLSANVRFGEAVTDIPFAQLSKPISDSRISLVSTAGLSMKGDEPFDMETEKRRPSWGDPSWRRLSSDVETSTIQANHLHIDTKHLLTDLDVCFPVPLLHQLATEAVIGEVADSHYSIMGFQGTDLRRIEPSCVAIADAMGVDGVDLAILIPV